jgi:endonuclease/exonuclease/phosphatase family metal-dependent hydrolase
MIGLASMLEDRPMDEEFSSPPNTITSDRSTLSVMTFNIGNGMVRPERLVQNMNSSPVDVVGLQEVSTDQAAALLRETEESFPYRVLSGAGFHGRGLLSRHPIAEHEWLEAAEGRPDLLVSVQREGGTVSILVGHPMPPRLGRRGVVFNDVSKGQIARFADVLTERTPAVLLADMNMTMRNPLHAYLLSRGLIDAHLVAGVGAGRTFPLRPGQIRRFSHPFTRVPLPAAARIDYVWHTPEIETDSVWVGDAIGSDHRPVMANLRVPNGRDADLEPAR